nr:retrovirus-related Pol polyprotein from transposon TNT 1-94 [Tanacetum cinerariifolium]
MVQSKNRSFVVNWFNEFRTVEGYRKLWEHVPSRNRGGDPIPQPTPQPISQPTPGTVEGYRKLWEHVLSRNRGGGPIPQPFSQPTPGTVKGYRKLWEHVPSRNRGGDPIPQPTPGRFTPINIKLDDLPWDPSDRPIIDTRPNGDALRKCILEVETLQTMSPENKSHYESEKEAIHLILTGIGDEIYSTVDACKTTLEIETMKSYYIRFYKMMNEMIRNNLTVATMQVNVQFLQQLQPEWSRNKNVDTTPRYKNDNQSGQFRSQRMVNVAGAVQQYGIQCLNCKEFGHFAKECRKPKRVKDFTYHKEKMLLCKQAEQGVPLQAEQSDWLVDTDEEVDEQELEAHYSYMAKIQEVPTANSGTDSEPLEQVQYNDEYNVFANVNQHCEQSKSTSNTCLVEKDDSDVTPDSPDMCEHDIQTDQNARDERDALANLIKNLKLDVNENKKIKKQLKKANTSLVHELEQYKSILAKTSKTLEESNSVRDSCLVALQTKQTEFEKHKAKHSISLELALQECQELMKNDTVCKEKASNVFQKEREQYFKIQDLKAQLQDKNIAISELKKLIEKCKGKSVETKFDKPFVVRQPNAQRIPNPSVLGKPTPFLDSLERKSFSKTKPVPKTNVSEGLSKPVTTQNLHQTTTQAVSNTKVIKLCIYRIDNRTTQTRAPQLPQTSRNTNPCMSTSTGIAHTTNVSRPQLMSNQVTDKFMPNNSHVKAKKTEVEDHYRISSISNKTQSIVQLILFIVDSGCTKHMMGNLKLLCNFVEKYLGTVRFGNDQFAPIIGYGDLVQGDITINRVYYVEGLNHNLFSVGQFCDADLEVAFRKSTCFVRDLQGNDLLTGNRGSDLYPIFLQETTSSTPLRLMAKSSSTQAWLWHRRLFHLNFDYINLLSKKDVMIGLPKMKYVKDHLCSSCEVSKAKRSSYKTKTVPSSKGRLNLLHMDLCGPMRVASINGKKYILVIVDDYFRYTWTLFLRSKDETPEVLKDFLTMIQRNLQDPVISIRTDKGTEFSNKTLRAFFNEEEIELQTSFP